MPAIKDAITALNKDQSKANWDRFGKSLKGSGLKYYSVKFDKAKVNKLEDLRKAYVELYDAKQRLVYKIPAVMNNKRKIRGATIYLKGLFNLNK